MLLDLSPLPDQKETLASRVYQQLRREIISCRLKPGQVINESNLIQQYGVSKTPVREALKQLMQERLVRSIPGACYLVTQVTVKDIVELFEMRIILEEAISLRASRNITDQQLVELEARIGSEFRLNTDEDLIRWYDMNLEFHLYLARIARNERLADALRVTLEEVNRFLMMDKEMYTQTGELVEHHRKIIDAMRQRDGALAARITIEDIETSLPRIKRLVEINRS
jgi:DNA-binding GntR family transcriptional regulator